MHVLTYFNRDARHFQIAFLATFLLVGVGFLGWSASLWKYATLLVACVGTQLLATRFTNRDYGSWRSALVTALGLSLLLQANSVLPLAVAGVLGILSKFALRAGGKHFFNPANFGIVAAIVLTGDAWVNPGQWGHQAVLCAWFVGLGAMVTRKVGRLDTSLTFLVVFGGLLFGWDVLYKGWEAEVWLHKLCNGSLLLFAFFMITDPRAIPNHRWARVGWTAAIAGGAFFLSTQLYVHTAVIWTLFFASPLTPLLDRLFPAKRFVWRAATAPVLVPAATPYRAP